MVDGTTTATRLAWMSEDKTLPLRKIAKIKFTMQNMSWHQQEKEANVILHQPTFFYGHNWHDEQSILSSLSVVLFVSVDCAVVVPSPCSLYTHAAIIPQSFQSAFWILSISLRTYGFCIMLWFSNGNNDLSSFSGHYLILHHSSMEVFIVLWFLHSSIA